MISNTAMCLNSGSRKKCLFLIYILTYTTFSSYGQFTAIPTELRGLRSGGVLWSDFDSDGQLDVFTFGDDTLANIYSSFYKNDSLSFTEFDVGAFPDLFDGSIDWADYNNDGHMDLAMIGYSSTDQSVITKILTYDSDFKELEYEFEGLARGAIDWGDYNGDGYKDLLAVGQNDQSNSVTRIFTYQPENDLFVELETLEATGVSFGDASWVDYNSDGLLDFIISGVTGTAPDTGSPVVHLYKNMGDSFELVFDDEFIGLSYSSIDWGDADLDGDLDLLITGYTEEYGPFSGVYVNNIEGFVLSEIDLLSVLEGFAKWGDMDDDGDLDILIAGNGVVEGRVLKVYENESMVFTEIFSGEGLSQCSGGWGDFNNDGRLDFFVNGQKEDLGLLATVYVNNMEDRSIKRIRAEKSELDVPSNPIITKTNEGTVEFSWDEEDAESVQSITYNVKIQSDEQLIISPLSLDAGERLVTEFGNAGSTNTFIANDLETGEYTFSVQKIDGTYNSSKFTSPISFTIERSQENNDSEIIAGIYRPSDASIKVYPNPSSSMLRLNSDVPVRFQIFTLLGTRILEGVTNNGEINIEKLGKGEYILQIFQASGNQNIRFAKN